MPYNEHDDKFTVDPGREGTAAGAEKLVLLMQARKLIAIEFNFFVANPESTSSINSFVVMTKNSADVKAYLTHCNNSVTAHWIIHRYICELLQAYICGRTFVPANAKEC